MRFRLRSRHLVLALFIVFIYLYTRTDIIPSRPKPYTIQAAFPPESADARKIRLQRRDEVKDAFKHAWKGYKAHAWLHDEVLPVSGGVKDPFAGWAATLVDSLDTLYIMGLKDEFAEAVKALDKIDFTKPNVDKLPVFEVVIRYLGGLLGAWDVSGRSDNVILVKAKQLGEFVSKVFDTPNGLPVPFYYWNLTDPFKPLPNEEKVIIAQVASLSLEFIRLSQVTGDPRYSAMIQNVTDQLDSTQLTTDLPGMWPIIANCSGPRMTIQDKAFSLGVLAGRLLRLKSIEQRY